MVAPLNATMIAVALPDLRGAFDVGRNEVAWLVSAYLIAMAVAMPVGGRVGDQIGRATTFRLGLVCLLIFSLTAAFAPSFVLLVILRTAQALAGAVVISNGIAMLRAGAGDRRFGEANGIIGAVMGFSAAAGPLLGGGLLEVGSWRLIFLASVVPVAAALLCQAVVHIEETWLRERIRIDWPGALALAGALVCLTYLLGYSGEVTPLALGTALVTLFIFGAFFVLRQLNSELPVAAWGLFRDRSYAGATAFVLLSNMIMYTALLAIPFFLSEVQGRGNAAAGLVLGAMSLLMVLLAPFTGRWSDRHGRRLPVVAGGGCMILAGLALVAVIDESVSPGLLAACLALLGFGIGLGMGPATAAAVESAPVSQAGVASGTVSMTRYVGSIIGAGLLGGALGDGATPDIDVFRGLFALMAVTAAFSIFAASQIHRFVPQHSAGGRPAEQLS